MSYDKHPATLRVCGLGLELKSLGLGGPQAVDPQIPHSPESLTPYKKPDGNPSTL